MESLFCDLQDLTVLVGLGLNSLLFWWWADPVAALVLVPFFVKEGLENLAGHSHGDEHGHGHEGHDDQHEHEAPPRVCFCGSCFFGVRNCRAVCCRA